MTKHENKNSAKKKLLPAVAMLTTSAVMLSTSTYAWFTMSREVEVTGLQMAATVPEDIQISLGALTNGELNLQTGIITGGTAVAPAAETDWSNSAIVSSYYAFGKIMPASSTNGQSIFFTPDASGVGKTVASEANYYQAADLLNAFSYKSDANTFANNGGGDSAMATLHAFNNTEKTGTATNGTWAVKSDTNATGYEKGTTWNKTNDDGYYIDVPVWIRSSSDSAVNLKVDGYVLPNSPTKPVDAANIELYKATRIAILNGADGTAVQTKNVIPLKDAWDSSDKNEPYYDSSSSKYISIKRKQNPYATENSSVLDSKNIKSINDRNFDSAYTTHNLDDLLAVANLGTGTKADGTGSYVPGVYNKYEAYNSETSSENVVATLQAPTAGKEYGDATKLVLRIWLDGEDEQCWNQNAGQDFAITLKFSKIEN